jgi:hypothetical protein
MKAMAAISSALSTISAGHVALAGVVIFLAFGALVLPGQSAAAERASGGAGSPDSSFYYTADELLQQAEAYGEAGRAAYVRARWTFDLAFPLVYGFFLVTSIGWALPRAAPAGSAWQRLNLVPVAAVLFDFLENTATSLVMARFPAVPPLAAALAPWMTLLKWLFVCGSFGVLVAVLASALVKALCRRPA